MGNTEFIKGVDISTIFEEIEAGAKYYDAREQKPENGVYNEEAEEVLTILKRYGINSVRIRLWNDPYSADGHKYGAGTNDLESTLRLARMAKEAGMSILYNFQYSDFWADPGKQIMPKAWKGLSVEELEEKVYDFTRSIMLALKDNGTLPEMVQVGNEVTNGLMWPVAKKPNPGEGTDNGYGNGYDNIARFISAGIRAVRQVSPESKVMIHLDNGGNNSMYRDWFDNYFGRVRCENGDGLIKGCPMNQKDMAVCGPVGFKEAEDIDMIGLSYYPFWHGSLQALEDNMKDMAARYGKPMSVVEVSMGFSMEDYRRYEKEDIDKLKGMATSEKLVEKLEYPMTKAGQCDFMTDFMNRVQSVDGALGFYYWEPAWIPVPGVGWANDYALAYTGEKGPGGNEWANQALFDYEGRALPALAVIRDF